MKTITKLIAPLVLATGLPLAVAGAAHASTDISITTCSISPSTISLASGQTQTITIGWEDGVNTPADSADLVYVEMAQNGSSMGGNVGPIGPQPPTNPYTIPYDFNSLSGALGGQAGTIKYSFFAVQGGEKRGSELCSLTATVAAPTPSTTTTVPSSTTTTVAPVTLAHTGSNVGNLVLGSALLVSVGGAMVVSARRRREINA